MTPVSSKKILFFFSGGIPERTMKKIEIDLFSFSAAAVDHMACGFFGCYKLGLMKIGPE
jgi:hypothetical protein